MLLQNSEINHTFQIDIVTVPSLEGWSSRQEYSDFPSHRPSTLPQLLLHRRPRHSSPGPPPLDPGPAPGPGPAG